MSEIGSEKEILRKEVKVERCSYCKENSSVEYIVYQKYAHILKLPIFPQEKSGYSRCAKCQLILTKDQMPFNVKNDFEKIIKETKTPLKTYVGLVIFIVFMTVIIINIVIEKVNTSKYIYDLHEGDLLEIKTKDSHYTYLKIVQLKSDTVYVRLNKYQVIMESGIDKIQTSDDDFFEDVELIPKANIIEKYNKGEVVNVFRN